MRKWIRFYWQTDLFIGIGCMLPTKGFMYDKAFSFNVELLFFGIQFGGNHV